MIIRTQDETTTTITMIILTFVGFVLFCLLAFLTPDSALLTGGEWLSVPLAGPISFLGFIVIGPVILIRLRVYLQIYIEHWRRLEPICRQLVKVRAPTLAPVQNPLLRSFAGLVIYLLLPVTMLAFTWKAAVLPAWGSGLLCITAAVAMSHLLLALGCSWRLGTGVSAATALVTALIVYALPIAYMLRTHGPESVYDGIKQGSVAYSTSSDIHGIWLVRRPFNLFHAGLSSPYLYGSQLQQAFLALADLRNVDLRAANLQDAYLGSANLQGANLQLANLQGASLTSANLLEARLQDASLDSAGLGRANLRGADLQRSWLSLANLAEADLQGANLRGAYLGGANLQGAKNLTQDQLDSACGDEKTRLPASLTIRTCPVGDADE
jgi:Pentapeptide repeats (8 copies)